MRHKVLIVDDEANIRELISLYLRQAGFEVVEAGNGRQALSLAQSEAPSLVILDLMLPERDGWEVCREIRARGETPVIILTARDAETEKLLGFALGADDYVTKPFQPRELVARVRAVLKRVRAPSEPVAVETPPVEGRGSSAGAAPATAPVSEGRVPPILNFGSFSLNRLSRELEVKGKTVRCTAKEFDLLWLLASNPGRVFGREEILRRVWDYSYFGDLRTVDVHVRRLRQKVEPRPDEPRYVLTVWGIGYKFKSNPEDREDRE